MFTYILLQHFDMQLSLLSEYLDLLLLLKCCLLLQVTPLSSHPLACIVLRKSRFFLWFSLPTTYRLPPKPLLSSSIFFRHLFFFIKASLQQSFTLLPTPPQNSNITFPPPMGSLAQGQQANLMFLSPVTTTLWCLVKTCSCISVTWSWLPHPSAAQRAGTQT